MVTFTLEELRESIELLSPVQMDFFSESCIVALEAHNHKTGCDLTVDGDTITSFKLNWSKKVNRNGYKEAKKVTEHAAEAISFFLSRQLTNFTVLEEAVIGTGFDYWLGYDEKHSNYNPLNFMQARLEISGISKEAISNNIQKRVKEKKAQTNPTDTMKLPAYISVVEFASPKAYFGIK